MSSLNWVVIVLVVLWLLGLVFGMTFGGWIHLLIIAALIVFVVRLFDKRTGRASGM